MMNGDDGMAGAGDGDLRRQIKQELLGELLEFMQHGIAEERKSKYAPVADEPADVELPSVDLPGVDLPGSDPATDDADADLGSLDPAVLEQLLGGDDDGDESGAE